LFQPAGESRRDFYAELPIKIQLSGGFHEFGNFVSGIAALPRIVTLHDIEITPGTTRAAARGRAPAPSDQLMLNLTAKTYRYLEEGESRAAEAEGKGGGKDTKPKRNAT